MAKRLRREPRRLDGTSSSVLSATTTRGPCGSRPFRTLHISRGLWMT